MNYVLHYTTYASCENYDDDQDVQFSVLNSL